MWRRRRRGVASAWRGIDVTTPCMCAAIRRHRDLFSGFLDRKCHILPHYYTFGGRDVCLYSLYLVCFWRERGGGFGKWNGPEGGLLSVLMISRICGWVPVLEGEVYDRGEEGGNWDWDWDGGLGWEREGGRCGGWMEQYRIKRIIYSESLSI